jgi:hypothetical protein
MWRAWRFAGRVVECGTTRVRDRSGSPGGDAAHAPRRFAATCGNVRQKSKYRQGYTETGAISASTGPNDACARQKLAFTS